MNKLSNEAKQSNTLLKQTHKKSVRHTYRVKKLRRLLPVGAMFLICITFLWSYIVAFLEKPIEGISRYTKLDLKNEATNIMLSSTDSNNNPFQIFANKIRQIDGTMYELTNPQSTLVMRNGEKINMLAQVAVFDKSLNNITYSDFILKHSGGIKLNTCTSIHQINKDLLYSDKPTVITLSNGTINSDKGFSLNKTAETLNLLGKTKIVINQK